MSKKALYGIAFVVAAPVFAQVTLDRDGGPNVTCEVTPTQVVVSGVVDCAPPSEPFCGDGTCDATEDCATCEMDCGACPPPPPVCGDALCEPPETCSTCEADCGVCPPAAGPPSAGLEAWWQWDYAHMVECGVEPAMEVGNIGDPPIPGVCGHHLPDVSGPPIYEATETSSLWWPEFEADNLHLSGTDQLLFQTCTNCNPGPCSCTPTPFVAGDAERWAFAFVGSFTGNGAILGNPLQDGNLSIMDFSTGGNLRVRLQSSGRVTISGTALPWDTRHALVVEYDAGTLRAWRRLPCGAGFVDVTTVPPPVLVRTAIFGCLSCYYPNGWINELGQEEPHYPGIMRFREGGLYRGAFDLGELFGYLDAEHGAWIDGGC